MGDGLREHGVLGCIQRTIIKENKYEQDSDDNTTCRDGWR